jgi:hypothetical protein
MVSIFSVHVTFGVVDPQFTPERIANVFDELTSSLKRLMGPGLAVIIPRPFPEDEEQQVIQAVSPGTHEINFIFDFDPNNSNFIDMLTEDTMCERYNFANEICSDMAFAALEVVNCVPTYFEIKISADYISETLYEKMKKQRFK